MPRFAANLTMMFNEVEFLDRFEAAAQAGFKAVEFLFPYEFPVEAIKARLTDFDLELVLFNMPPGNWQGGDRGLAAMVGREAEFAASIAPAMDYARALGCKRLHCMAGIASGEQARETLLANLRQLADIAIKEGCLVLLEPINLRDMPGYFLSEVDQSLALIAEIGRENVKLQLDFYHRQITRGDLSACIAQTSAVIGHIQISNPPDRGEPVDGEIDYATLFKLIDDSGYGGWVGCEYRPRATTLAGLAWVDRLGVRLR